MRLARIRIQNFRSFKDETIELDAYVCFVGPNGAGKSTVLAALNVFFRETSAATDVLTLTEEDFHRRNTADPIKISLTFRDLTDDEIETFSHYYRQDELTIFAKAVWNADTASAPVTQHGERMVLKAFSRFFEVHDAKGSAVDLKEIYAKICETYSELPVWSSKPKAYEALRAYEEAHPNDCEATEAASQFYGFTSGKDRLDPFIQWVYVPAVKDAATEEQENSKTAVGKIVARIRGSVDFKPALNELKNETEEKYKAILTPEQEKLKPLQQRLEKRFRQWSNPDSRLALGWDYDRDKTLVVGEPFAHLQIGEGDFLGSVARLGHGMQRSLLVTVLEELASGNVSTGPHLILGIEEPELYQHPPQALHLADVLQQLASEVERNSQVFVTTHSPYFADFGQFEQVRMVRKQTSSWESKVKQARFDDISKMLAEALGDTPQHPSELMGRTMQVMQPSQRELFFSRVAILVEGIEDVAYIATHLHLTNKWTKFREYGCHFIVCEGKRNLSRPLAIALALEIPVFVVFDSDAHNEQNSRQHKRDNMCLLKLCGYGGEDPLPKEHRFLPQLVLWDSTIGQVVKNEMGQKDWDEAYRSVRDEFGIDAEQALSGKIGHVISATLEKLCDNGQHSVSLTRLCDQILSYAKEFSS